MQRSHRICLNMSRHHAAELMRLVTVKKTNEPFRICSLPFLQVSSQVGVSGLRHERELHNQSVG